MPKITSVEPLTEYRLKVAFDNGNILVLDLSRKLLTTRFRQLAQPEIFESARADGERVYWNEMTELSTGELMELVLADARSGADGRPGWQGVRRSRASG